MLFNSLEFIGVFLPLTLAGFFVLGFFGAHRVAVGFLVIVSLFFYGWWNPQYLGLIITSVTCNYGIARCMERFPRSQRTLLLLGITGNLALIGYYKYAHFFLDTVTQLSGFQFSDPEIILPLGISFFTFQQITYLVDIAQHKVGKHNFLYYCLYVTFFPQLIAGPIVHHGEMLSQFFETDRTRFQAEHLVVGVTIFFIGLMKKVVFADHLGPFASPVFAAADMGHALSFFESWGAALAYTLQLYFDFSGYSDMAIGAAYMFGIWLPINFASPYKSQSISEFWRRWHMTLSRFLREYLYFPLGGSRRGALRTSVNLFITMLLGGLWHGAGWTFVFWGGLHGAFLVINHLWSSIWGKNAIRSFMYRVFARSLTFLAVLFSWVFFRATTFSGATEMVRSMLGLHGVALPSQLSGMHAFAWLKSLGAVFTLQDSLVIGAAQWAHGLPLIAGLLLVVLFAPNTQQYMALYWPQLSERHLPQGRLVALCQWKPTVLHAVFSAAVTIIALVFLILSQQSEFLYFQF